LETARALNSTYETIEAHFWRVQNLIRRLSITEDIWNMGETGIAMGLSDWHYTRPENSWISRNIMQLRFNGFGMCLYRSLNVITLAHIYY